jgi:hypothetical protein
MIYGNKNPLDDEIIDTLSLHRAEERGLQREGKSPRNINSVRTRQFLFAQHNQSLKGPYGYPNTEFNSRFPSEKEAKLGQVNRLKASFTEYDGMSQKTLE